MVQLCPSPPPSLNKAHTNEMSKAKLKRSPRCMQIDLLPFIASNITMTTSARSPHGPNSSNTKISPVLWDEKLCLWTRNGTLLPSIPNSEVDHCFEEQLQSVSNANEPPLIPYTTNDEESSNEIQFLTTSTLDSEFSHDNIVNAPIRAWSSSLVDGPNYQANNVIAPPEKWIERENHPEDAPQLLIGVERVCTHLNPWDASKTQGNELEKLLEHRSHSLNDWHQCTTLIMKGDEDEECTTIHEDYFVDPQVEKALELCPPFTSPWFNPKTHPFSEALNSSPNGSLDWTCDEARDVDDMDAHGFDGLGLRPESESSRVRARRSWNGDNQEGSGRNVRRRTELLSPWCNIIGNEFLDNYDGFDPGDNLPRWFPQPGDILVTKRSRRAAQLSSGGHVTLYKHPQFFYYILDARNHLPIVFDFEDGDVVIRLGKFTEDWKWHPSPSIEAFLCDLRQVRPWWLVARTYNNELQPPVYQFDPSQSPLNVVDRNFRPRDGDLVVRAVPSEYTWGLYWWTHYFNFNPCDLVLRAGYEIRANGTCMVVELYYREIDDRDWSFRGRDMWTYLQARSPPRSPPDSPRSTLDSGLFLG